MLGYREKAPWVVAPAQHLHESNIGNPADCQARRFGTTGLATVTLSGGKALYTTAALPTGTDYITASRAGSYVYRDGDIQHQFQIYTFRHTCLTRWAAHMDPYTLAYLAGHSDFSTTRRYVHPQVQTVRDAIERARNGQPGRKPTPDAAPTQESAASGTETAHSG